MKYSMKNKPHVQESLFLHELTPLSTELNYMLSFTPVLTMHSC